MADAILNRTEGGEGPEGGGSLLEKEVEGFPTVVAP
jgi:hypothetical protein